MKTQTLPKGTILKFMGEIPVRLLNAAEVECGTDLSEIQDAIIDSRAPSNHTLGQDEDEQ